MSPYSKKQKIFIFTYPILHFVLFGIFTFMAFSSGFWSGEETATSQLGVIGFNVLLAPYALVQKLLPNPYFYSQWPSNLLDTVGIIGVLMIGLLYGWVYVLIYKLVTKK
jgi:hypothetical protein